MYKSINIHNWLIYKQVKEFMEILDKELGKVNEFYTAQESECCKRGEDLIKQLQILADIKRILHEYRRRQHNHRHRPSSLGSPATPGSAGSLLSGLSSPASPPG